MTLSEWIIEKQKVERRVRKEREMMLDDMLRSWMKDWGMMYNLLNPPPEAQTLKFELATQEGD